MIPSDFHTFDAALGEFALYFPHSKPDLGFITRGYFRKLMVLDFSELNAVFDQALDKCKIFPTIAELRELGKVEQREQALLRQQEQYHESRALPLGRNAQEDEASLAEMRKMLAKIWPDWSSDTDSEAFH